MLVCCFYILEHFSRVDADPHEVALWVLLKRTQSPNKAIRLHAVQELAENHHWHGKSCKIYEFVVLGFFLLYCGVTKTHLSIKQTISIKQQHKL